MGHIRQYFLNNNLRKTAYIIVYSSKTIIFCTCYDFATATRGAAQKQKNAAFHIKIKTNTKINTRGTKWV
jgi:hypothetical protein